uniref:Putative oxidoreductase YqhD n=1 Tax=uncultured bacterium contig00176 TaxID=1181598 RepID=A0A806KKE1_9BACT|nr:putative oxidoreductase YqhD [uncultured bacterium contig00176]
MDNFTYRNPVRIFFGRGMAPSISTEIPSDAKIMLICGGGSIRNNGVYDQVVSALKGFSFIEFWGVEPNPVYETLMKAVDLARKEKIDFLLAVGGGSVVDGTKLIAAAIPFEGDPWEIVQRKAKPTKAVPFGCVLTLPATGTEMNCNAVITRQETKEKLSFINPIVYPRFSVLDPEHTFSLPPKQVANGIVDAFVHVTEQYLTFPAQASIQDRFSESILCTLIEEGPKTLASPTDYDSRANLVWAATMALNGLIACGVPQDWSTHTIGHELTAFFGLDHAQTLAIVLPNLLWVQRDSKRQKLIQYARRVWNIDGGDEAKVIEGAIGKTRKFFESLGLPTRLSELGINEDITETIVSRFHARKALPMGESNDLDESRIREILRLAR